MTHVLVVGGTVQDVAKFRHTQRLLGGEQQHFENELQLHEEKLLYH